MYCYSIEYKLVLITLSIKEKYRHIIIIIISLADVKGCFYIPNIGRRNKIKGDLVMVNKETLLTHEGYETGTRTELFEDGRRIDS